MNFRIRYNREKIKELMSSLHKAYELGDIHIVKRVSAMLRIHEGQSVKDISQILGVSLQAVYNWLKAFLVIGYAANRQAYILNTGQCQIPYQCIYGTILFGI